jgi:hypothetical protein
LTRKIIRVSASALCLPFVTLQGREGLHVVGDVGGGASETLAVEGEGVLETGGVSCLCKEPWCSLERFDSDRYLPHEMVDGQLKEMKTSMVRTQG